MKLFIKQRIYYKMVINNSKINKKLRLQGLKLKYPKKLIHLSNAQSFFAYRSFQICQNVTKIIK